MDNKPKNPVSIFEGWWPHHIEVSWGCKIRLAQTKVCILWYFRIQSTWATPDCIEIALKSYIFLMKLPVQKGLRLLEPGSLRAFESCARTAPTRRTTTVATTTTTRMTPENRRWSNTSFAERGIMREILTNSYFRNGYSLPKASTQLGRNGRPARCRSAPPPTSASSSRGRPRTEGSQSISWSSPPENVKVRDVSLKMDSSAFQHYL